MEEELLPLEGFVGNPDGVEFWTKCQGDCPHCGAKDQLVWRQPGWVYDVWYDYGQEQCLLCEIMWWAERCRPST